VCTAQETGSCQTSMKWEQLAVVRKEKKDRPQKTAGATLLPRNLSSPLSRSRWPGSRPAGEQGRPEKTIVEPKKRQLEKAQPLVGSGGQLKNCRRRSPGNGLDSISPTWSLERGRKTQGKLNKVGPKGRNGPWTP